MIEVGASIQCTECGGKIGYTVRDTPTAFGVARWLHEGLSRPVYSGVGLVFGVSVEIAAMSRHLHEQNKKPERPIVVTGGPRSDGSTKGESRGRVVGTKVSRRKQS